jgi:hypothetical protein
MTGIFPQFQPRYAEHGIATFPIRPDKVAMMKHWGFVGLPASAKLARKFDGADAFAYRCGTRSNVTVLDVDTTDEKIVEDAIRRHGQPRIVVRTASSKFHCLYRYNRERRRIRPWGKEIPIDLLGEGKGQGGYAIAAPSKVATGQYEIIHGHLDDLDRLTPMVGLDGVEVPPTAVFLCPRKSPLSGMREHDGRNHALFIAMAPIARTVHQASGMRDQLLAIAREHNAQCAQPMEDSEVSTIVSNIWQMTREGRNVVGLRSRAQGSQAAGASGSWCATYPSQGLNDNCSYSSFNHGPGRSRFQVVARAITRPMPLAAPVTMATRPASNSSSAMTRASRGTMTNRESRFNCGR